MIRFVGITGPLPHPATHASILMGGWRSIGLPIDTVVGERAG